MTASRFRSTTSSGTPFALLLLYLALFGFFEHSLGFGAAFEGISELVFRVETEARIHYRLALALWGSTLICFGTIGTVIVAHSAMHLSRLAAPVAKSDGARLCIATGAGVLLYFLTWLALDRMSLSGGFAHALYGRFDAEPTSTLENVFKLMNTITAMTLVPALAITFSLCGLLQDTRAAGPGAGAMLAARLQRLLALTAAFLCVGIVQVYFQYQCLTVLLEDRALAMRITSLMTLAMSIFYTGLSLTLFVPTGYLMHRLIYPTTQEPENKVGPASLPQHFLGGDFLHQLRSAGLLLSPLLTGLIAELPVLLGDS